MNLLRRFVIRAAQELRHNPEARAKASQVLEEQVKPRAEQAWREAQPKNRTRQARTQAFRAKGARGIPQGTRRRVGVGLLEDGLRLSPNCL